MLVYHFLGIVVILSLPLLQHVRSKRSCRSQHAAAAGGQEARCGRLLRDMVWTMQSNCSILGPIGRPEPGRCIPEGERCASRVMRVEFRCGMR